MQDPCCHPAQQTTIWERHPQGRAAELERQLHDAEARESRLVAEATQARQRAADVEAAAQAEASQRERQQVCFLNTPCSSGMMKTGRS